MIRVLVVDDSAVLRQQLCFILQSDPAVEVIGQARNGTEALSLAKQLRPDVITMDIRMPHMDGFEAISHIMAESPAPIVVVTGSGDDREEVAAKALKLGAVSVLRKPGAVLSMAERAQADRLIEQVKLMSEVRVVTRVRPRHPLPSPMPAAILERPPMQPPVAVAAAKVKMLAIGASTGGPAALYQVLSRLPAEFPVPVLVVQHISFGFVHGLAGWLNGGCRLPVMVPDHGDRLQPGVVYLAPDEHHMGVTRFGRIRLSAEPPVGGHRPSVTMLFQSLAEAYGPAALAVILTGMGADGALGMRALKNVGARTIAQDEQSCVVFGMPKEAIAMGAIDHIVPLDDIAALVTALCGAQG